MPVGGVGADVHPRPLRDAVAHHPVVLHDLAREHDHRRVEPHRLVEDHPRVRQLRQILRGGIPPAELRIELRVQPRLDLRVLREQRPRPPEQRGGGLVPGDEHGEHLAAQLRVVHPFAGLLVLREHQHGEEITPVTTLGAAAGDDRVHHVVERALRDAPLPVCARGEHRRQDAELAHALGELVVDDAEGGVHRADLVLAHAGAEQRPGDDGEGEPHHLGGHVHRLRPARLPLQRESARGLRHPLRHLRDALPMERGLGEPALTKPGLAVGGEEAVGDDPAQHRVAEVVLGVVGRVVLQHPSHRVRMQRHVREPRAEAEAGHLAVLLHQPAQRAEHVLADLGEDPHQRRALVAGGPLRSGRGRARGRAHAPEANGLVRPARRSCAGGPASR